MCCSKIQGENFLVELCRDEKMLVANFLELDLSLFSLFFFFLWLIWFFIIFFLFSSRFEEFFSSDLV